MASQPLPPGTRVGRYEVVAHVASGGMGEVYRARDVELGRDVALKVLAGRLVDNPAAVERFRREARAAARLSHKNIVTLYDWGQDGGTYFLAMEFVDGPDLNSHIALLGRLDPQEAWRIIIQAARALDHASRQGITHRDIKPSNFLLVREGRKLRVKLTDLGLSRSADDEEFRVTRDGTTVGTVDYLAPEQARDSASADIRSDIYSLGCTLYHMLAGNPPFPGGGLGERLYKHMEVEPPDVRDLNPEVPAALWSVLQRMLAKRPEDRYQTPAELLEALLALHGGAAQRPESGPDIPALGAPGDRLPALLRGALPAPPTGSPESSSEDLLGVSGERRRAAANQFERAREIIASGEAEKRYAYDLLVSCITLDPANTAYREELRRLAQRQRQRLARSNRKVPLGPPAARARLTAAKQAGEHLKVLEHGEGVLADYPEDVATHLDMAEAAAALNLPQLRVWLLEQACKQNPTDSRPMRLLARAHEQQKSLGRAVTVWQALRRIQPDDAEAAAQLDTLLRRLARAYERQNNRNGAVAVWQAVLKLRPRDAEATGQISALARDNPDVNETV